MQKWCGLFRAEGWQRFKEGADKAVGAGAEQTWRYMGCAGERNAGLSRGWRREGQTWRGNARGNARRRMQRDVNG